MKKTVKYLAAIATAFAVVTLAACGASKEDNSKSATDKIKDKGKIVFGVKQDVPNFGYKDPKTNEFTGVEIDIANEIAKDLGVKAEFVPVTAQTRGPLLDNGQVDAVLATFTITDERKKSYNFTTPYFTDEAGFLVNKASGFTDVKDLDGKTIGVAQSSSTKDGLEALAKQEGISFKYSELADYPTLKTALTSGRIDAFAVDKSILSGYVDDKTEILGEGFAPQEYGIATKKSNTELADYLDKTVNNLKDDGGLKKLTDKYNLKDATAK
ncbi:glutamine ABC transporter substrate-binding protein [Lactococcus hodotermopsidis]|uniref:Glutamine ABC transporter substrate-binding protein n=1 Tax=Pseudolactococcus hodotermopsidis TaxID=2709157 RepID=A0A6A0BEC3_9LACT|nr:transporter substrate-binding domain-containing protein [Lactococcus hodotermopsidis]GFH43053.1 glutamine ABC transporter substrate-binding protein [Lactococcus hodotermopsidis]